VPADRKRLVTVVTLLRSDDPDDDERFAAIDVVRPCGAGARVSPTRKAKPTPAAATADQEIEILVCGTCGVSFERAVVRDGNQRTARAAASP